MQHDRRILTKLRENIQGIHILKAIVTRASKINILFILPIEGYGRKKKSLIKFP